MERTRSRFLRGIFNKEYGRDRIPPRLECAIHPDRVDRFQILITMSPDAAPKIISSPPPFISPEEHKRLTSTTPESFSSIPPVLRLEEPNVSVSFDPPLQDFGPDDCKRGTLYIIERCTQSCRPSFCSSSHSLSSVLAFISTTGRGFQLEYPSITLHAISRAESGPCVYCQLDETPTGDEPENGEDDSPMRELKIVPEREGARKFPHTVELYPNVYRRAFVVEPIFESMSGCAALHPDPEEKFDGSDDAFVDTSNFEVFEGDADQELSEVGRVRSDFVTDNRYAPY